MKISIVVPVYKAERHLAETLDSLLSQTHEDIEVVCVDDGSPDGCWTILERYANEDPRVVPIRQENRGVSAARNTGISHATGDILMFVDADDTLLPHACERVNHVFEAKSAEVFTFGLLCDPPEAAPASLRRELSPSNAVYDGFQPNLLFKEYARPYACRTAVSHDFVKRENIRFEEGLGLAEDQVFYFAVYPFSKRTVLSSEKLYVYRMNDESATHAAFDTASALHKKLDAHMTAIEAICRIWNERDLRDFCAAELLEWCLDFTMLDIGRLPAPEQRDAYRRFMLCLDEHFGDSSEKFARRGPTKACLDDIRQALAQSDDADGSVISKWHKVRFFLMRRGFVRCTERVLMKLGIVK